VVGRAWTEALPGTFRPVFDLDRWRERYAWLDRLLRVHERFAAIGGGPLSSSIGLAGFLSLFPLLLVLIAVVGFVSSENTDFAARIVEELGLEGRGAEVVTDAINTAEGSRRTATVVGLIGLIWASLGVVGALQAACNAAWQTTGRGLIDKAVALAWLLGAGLLFLVTLSLGPVAGLVPGPVTILPVALGVALTTLLFTWTFSFLGNHQPPWRAHVPGAVLVAIGFEILKLVGTVLIPRMVTRASALYGAIGVVFAVLAWLLLYARLIVYGLALNVTRWESSRGTVTVEIEVPRIGGEVPLAANRGGAVDQAAAAPDP
jgi:membrane protein